MFGMVPALNKLTELLYMSKLFDIAGVSQIREDQPLKFRVANGQPSRRARTLERAGCVNIQLFQLPQQMTKSEAWAWFQTEHADLASQAYVSKADLNAAKKPQKESAKSTEIKIAEPLMNEVAADVTVVEQALSPAAKLALKRARDAARKREKRAAERVAREANKQVA